MIDVIIPTRNRLELTLEAVRSVQEQTFENWKLWVMDDASDDGSVDALEEVLRDDDRITVVRGKRQGPVLQRQDALELGKAEWIALLDSDDLWLPSKLSKQIELAGKSDIVLCWHEWFRPDGSVRSTGKPALADVSGGEASILATNNMSTPLLKREWLLSRGGFWSREDEAPFLTCDNIEMYVRLLPGARVSVVEEVLTRCRDHHGPRNSDSNAALRGAEEMKALLDMHAELLSKYPVEASELESRAGARYIAAGDRKMGYSFMWKSLLGADFSRVIIWMRKYVPFIVKESIKRNLYRKN